MSEVAVPVYMIVNLIITDKEEYRLYEKGFFALLKKYEGTFVTYDDNSVTLEGCAPREGRMIIFCFPTKELGEKWYADVEYQKLSERRRAGTEMQFLTMVHGLAPRD